MTGAESGQDSNSAQPPQDADDSKIAVDDPQDYAKTRMLRSTFDALDHYRQIKRKAQKKMVQSRTTDDVQFDTLDRSRLVYDALQEVLMTAEPILKESDEGRELWEEKTYEIAPAVTGIDPSIVGRHHRRRRQKRKKFRDGESVITGLDAFLSGASFYLMTDANAGLEIRRGAPPPSTCNSAYRDVVRHLSDVGLGIDLTEETQTKIDEKTIEEVEQWRQENVQ